MPHGKITVSVLLIAMFCVPAPFSLAHAQPPDSDAGPRASDRRFDLQAHRGGMGEVQPGDSLPAFEHALDLGVDTLEMDARLTKDGVIVVIHEARLGSAWHREGGDQSSQQEAEARVAALSARELQEYQHPVSPSPDQLPEGFSKGIHLGTRRVTAVPTLEEVFELVDEYANSESKSAEQRRGAKRVRFCIEMKQAGFEKAIVELVGKKELGDRVIIQSFNFDSLGYVSELDPGIATMALSFLPVEPREIAERTEAEYWAPYSRFLTAAKTEAAQQLGLLVVPWTVNGEQALEQFVSWGVDGVMTDYPGTAVEKLREMKVRRLSE